MILTAHPIPYTRFEFFCVCDLTNLLVLFICFTLNCSDVTIRLLMLIVCERVFAKARGGEEEVACMRVCFIQYISAIVFFSALKINVAYINR